MQFIMRFVELSGKDILDAMPTVNPISSKWARETAERMTCAESANGLFSRQGRRSSRGPASAMQRGAMP